MPTTLNLVNHGVIAQAERGLSLFKTGIDASRFYPDGTPREGRAPGLGFTDRPWGDIVRVLVNTPSKLNSRQWAGVIHHASAYVHVREPGIVGEGKEDGIGPATDPHANLVIDWYVFLGLKFTHI